MLFLKFLKGSSQNLNHGNSTSKIVNYSVYIDFLKSLFYKNCQILDYPKRGNDSKKRLKLKSKISLDSNTIYIA